MPNPDNNYFDRDITITEIIVAVWKKKILVALVTACFALFSVFYSLSLPNIYTSSAVLAPTSSDESLKSQLGSYSALAGFAGINLSNDSSNKAVEAIERIKSYDFFINEFIPHINYENLVAVEEWVEANNTIKYNANIFNTDNSEWLKLENPSQKSIPSYQEAFDIYKSTIHIEEDMKTFYYNFSVEHHSPYIAQKWLNLIIRNINEYMRKLDKAHAENSISYLNTTSQEVKLNEVKEAISQLLTNQIQTLMLVEASEDYVFKPISSPLVPEKKSKPSRALICIFFTIIGFFIGIVLAISATFLNYRKS